MAQAPRGHENGMDGYDKYAFEPFAVTVDLAVFTVRAGALHVLLIQRGQEPYAGHWALPGGFVLPDESAETAARRELAEETGLVAAPGGADRPVVGLHLEQLRTYSDPDRDPRMRVVSVAFAALVPDPPPDSVREDPQLASLEPRGGGDAAHARWLPYDGLVPQQATFTPPLHGQTLPAAAPGPLAFDHDRILADAHDRVCAKLEYTCLATSFCPPEFTLGELQQVYESVWGTALDRPNFRRKVLATPGFVEQVPGAVRLTGGRGKPAALYRAGGATALYPPLLRPVTEGRSS
ncbi:NUDIX hydrolase [Streptomyces sp. NPDC001020]